MNEATRTPASASTPCPACGATTSMPVPAAHAAGTTNLVIQTSDTIMDQILPGTKKGTQQTQLAAKCSPPISDKTGGRAVNDKNLEKWKASLICLRCHHIWVPAGSVQDEQAATPPIAPIQAESQPATIPSVALQNDVASADVSRSSGKSGIAQILTSTIRWIFVVISAIIGLGAFTTSALSGLCFFLIAVLFLPQFQPMVAQIFGRRLPRSLVIVAVPILFVAGGLFGSSTVSAQQAEVRQRQAAAEQQAAIAKSEENRQKNAESDRKELEEFMGKRADIVAGAQKAFDEGHYENVLATTGAYVKYKDPEIERIRSESQAIVDRNAAEAAALSAKAKAAAELEKNLAFKQRGEQILADKRKAEREAAEKIPPMAATVDDFESRIPLMKKRGHKTSIPDGVATYSWRNLSLIDRKHFVVLRDANGDGTPERGVIGVEVMIGDDNKAKQSFTEALVLSFAVVTEASGEVIDGKDFASWVATAKAGENKVRLFGKVRVSLSRIDAGDGSLITLGLNE